MRSALALSALLLLLLPPRSLSETGDPPAPASNPITDHITSSKSDADRSDGRQAVVPAVTSKAPPATEGREASATTSAPVNKNLSLAPSASTGAPFAAPTQKSTAVPTTDKDGASLATPPPSTDPPATQGSSQSALPPTTKSTKPDPTGQPAGSGAQSSPGVSTDDTATQGTGAPASASPLVRSTGATPAPSTATPTRPPQPATTASLKPLGSSSQEPDKITITSSSLGTETSPGPTLSGAPTTPTSSAASQGNQQYSSKVPAVPGTSVTETSSSVTETAASVTETSSSVTGTSSSVTGTSSVIGTSSSVPGTSSSEALQPAVPSSGPVATSVIGPGSFITPLAPNTPVSRMSYPPSTPKNDGALPAVGGQIWCGLPENQTEGMLVLNFTKTSPCVKDFSDDHLVELLCKAAKATFNAAKDKCRIQLAPIPEAQAVAVKEITIQTNLSPTDVYESLKDKWDELRQAGVSNMKLGDQGPPEETEDRFSMPLIITIVCMASFLLLVAALYGCCHQRLSQRKDQQRLTEELQTVENGYHDNPTLEVMETSSEMQEKKVVSLNGELGDSWIVPLDNLTKDDLDEEEDTHL